MISRKLPSSSTKSTRSCPGSTDAAAEPTGASPFFVISPNHCTRRTDGPALLHGPKQPAVRTRFLHRLVQDDLLSGFSPMLVRRRYPNANAAAAGSPRIALVHEGFEARIADP